jgi:hypothetical protein
VQGRDDWHPQLREKRDDLASGLAPEYPELVLQAEDVEALSIQKVRGSCVILCIVLPDLQSDLRRIVVGLTCVRHGHDGGLDVRACAGDSGLQVGGECRDAAAAWQ